MKQWIHEIIRLVSGRETEKKAAAAGSRQRIFTRLLILAMCGALLLLAGRIFSSSPAASQQTSKSVFSTKDAKTLSDVHSKVSKSTSSIDNYENYASQNLKNILDQIQGVSDVSVMITFSSTEKKIYQNNIKTQDNQTLENDRNGGTRQVDEKDQDSEVVMVDKNGVKEPVVVGQEQPNVRGVVVVARGAAQPATRADIMEAVATVMDVPEYKVKVLQKSE